MFLTIGKGAIPSRILKVYGLDEIYEVSSSTFCVKNCGKTFGTVRFSGAGAGCGLPVRVRVRFTCGQNLARTPESENLTFIYLREVLFSRAVFIT